MLVNGCILFVSINKQIKGSYLVSKALIFERLKQVKTGRFPEFFGKKGTVVVKKKCLERNDCSST